jgi:hypothetical protein
VATVPKRKITAQIAVSMAFPPSFYTCGQCRAAVSIRQLGVP